MQAHDHTSDSFHISRLNRLLQAFLVVVVLHFLLAHCFCLAPFLTSFKTLCFVVFLVAVAAADFFLVTIATMRQYQLSSALLAFKANPLYPPRE
jgi:uncharacterized Tic20 family protein